MYSLTVVARENMEIETAFYLTQEEATNAMYNDIKTTVGCDDMKTIKADLDESEGEFISDNSACIQTNHCGTVCYSIIKVPSPEQLTADELRKQKMSQKGGA